MKWPLKTGDFFPYHWFPHQYWTGYFTSRPTLKAFIRRGGEFLRAAKSLAALVSLGEGDLPANPGGQDAFWALSEALGVAQHHDAVSGTAKQHVTNDYAARIARGLAEAEPHFARALAAATAAAAGPRRCQSSSLRSAKPECPRSGDAAACPLPDCPRP